jgi:hypothetical protein
MHIINNKGNNKIINILHANKYVNENLNHLPTKVGFGANT